MAQKAQQHVDDSMSNVRTAVDSLQQALNKAENPDNQNKIQSAIDSLNSANQQLSGYRD